MLLFCYLSYLLGLAMRRMFRLCVECFNRRRLDWLVDYRASLFYHGICALCSNT
jgi:hypothetical protein